MPYSPKIEPGDNVLFDGESATVLWVRRGSHRQHRTCGITSDKHQNLSVNIFNVTTLDGRVGVCLCQRCNPLAVFDKGLYTR